MKTTQTYEQEVPAPRIVSETVLHSQDNPLYDRAEATRIAELLADMYDPEYILLFGSLAGGTPHSEVLAYDLLIVTQDVPYYGWQSAKRYLKMKLPPKNREIPYTNIYLVTRNTLQSSVIPFVRLAHAEGVALYRNDHSKLNKLKSRLDYQAIYCDAKKHYDIFRELGDDFLRQANTVFIENNLRQAAFLVGQAAELFYQTLYFVYHGQETDDRDLLVMHERVRTLSAELMLIFDDSHYESNSTLQELRLFLAKARYDPSFEIDPRHLEGHLDRVEKLNKVVEKLCQRRIDLYKQRIAK